MFLRNALPAPRGAKHEGVRDIAIMQIQEIGRSVIGLKDREVFAAKVIIPLSPGKS